MEKYEIRRYKYAALIKRIRQLAEKTELKKPCDFYNLRHSSCVLDKLDNLPLDVAADRHGHSVEYFTQIYGRLNLDNIANRMRMHYTGKEEMKKLDTNIVCEKCGFTNEKERELCAGCGSPLSLKVALEIKEREAKEMAIMVIDMIHKKEKGKEFAELK